MINTTVSHIAELVNGKIEGKKDTTITGIAGIKDAKNGDITFLSVKKYCSFLETTNASAILINSSIDFTSDKTFIRVENASNAFNKIITTYFVKKNTKSGISEKAHIGKNVKLGNNIYIGPFATIEDDVEIKDNTSIEAGSYIGNNVKIGSNTKIYPNVTILEKVIIGSNVIIHSGSVLGSDGFGFEPDKNEKGLSKLEHIGTVIIEDNVEIQSNVSIDRGRFDKTIIQKGSKIDNLVHIAHNVSIGKNCMILGQVGIAGSTRIGDNVIMAGQSGASGHINIGNNVIITSKGGAINDIKDGEMISFYPPLQHKKFRRVAAIISKLPEIYNKLKNIEKILKINEKTKNN